MNGHAEFEALANQHKDEVYRQMLRACRNREDAEDVLIEALLKAYRNIDQLRNPEAFRTWLASIGRRVCWRLKRREAIMPLMQLSEMEEHGLELASDAASPEQQWEAHQMKQLMESALETLPQACRRVYEMRDLENQPGETVAKALGISLTAMKSRLHRARTLMRDRIVATVA